jgi:hypothetical protein
MTLSKGVSNATNMCAQRARNSKSETIAFDLSRCINNKETIFRLEQELLSVTTPQHVRALDSVIDVAHGVPL